MTTAREFKICCTASRKSNMKQATRVIDAQGHRGARGLVAENTLASFARALSIGVHSLELDLLLSLDDVVVVSHNPRLELETTRNSRGAWLSEIGPAVRSLTLEELKLFDVGGIKPGTPYHKKFLDQQVVADSRIPTLEEVLLLVKKSGNSNVCLNVEIKSNPTTPDLFAGPGKIVETVLGVIDQHDFMHRISLQSFDWEVLQHAQRLDSSLPTGYLTLRKSWLNSSRPDYKNPLLWAAGYNIDDYAGSFPRMIKAAGGSFWSVYYREITAEQIKEAHALGLEVKVWTVNAPAQMESLIQMGADGVITDYPDRLRKVLKKLNLPIPKKFPVAAQ
jgi:glycerophosphoryl diester phosphodiesterase